MIDQLSKMTTVHSKEKRMIGQYDDESDFEVKRDGSGITIAKYTGSKTEVNIPPFIQNLLVTGIGESAFEGCISLTAITIPDDVRYIENYAFLDCTSLASVTIPNKRKTARLSPLQNIQFV